MNYEQEILRVLAFAGSDGLHVAKISKHVYNALNSFFCPLNTDDVHQQVANYLLRQSKTSTSIIEKLQRGVYRLNPNSKETDQLMLKFFEDTSDDEPTVIKQDNSLSLF
ncbi:MAG: hypothetical protein J6M54_02840 [Prevotella sp.]|nr:hypothetical protein [Prevotella sp.]MBQ9178277.1 hypothetical protein [Prevotella sp.]